MWRWTLKSLLGQPLALTASVLAAGAAFLLVLLFEAMYRGESEQIVAYVKNAEADVWVMQRGVGNMHMATSYLSDWKATLVADVPGVARLDGILYLNTVVTAGGSHWYCYVVGLDSPQTRAGPWDMAAGRSVPGMGEAVIPATFERLGGPGLGETIRIIDQEFTVAGLSADTFSMANSVIFVSRTDLEDLMSSLDIFSFLLVQAEPDVDPQVLARRIEDSVDKVSALTRAEFIANDLQMARQMGVETIAIMTIIGGVLAMLLVVFTCYSLVARQRHEMAVVKAIGGESRQIYLGIMLQGGLVTLASVATATLLALACVPILAALVPQVTLHLTLLSVARIGAMGLLVALAASVWPAWQVARVDPASAFQS